MKHTFKRTLAVAIMVIALLTNCKKAEVGPKGATGPQGPAGPAGNANVLTSNSVELDDWALEDGNYVSVLTYSAITEDVRDKGVVSVYLKNGNNWIPLPFTGLNTGTDALTYEIQMGKVKLVYYDPAEVVEDPSDWGLAVKIVVVPSSQMKKRNHVVEETGSSYSISQ